MTPIIWTNERRKISDLKPADYNPRFATEKEVNDLNASLDQFNLADPIVINKGGERDNIIIGGHFRVRIMQARGVEECDVRVPNRMLTLEEEMRLNLRLNKNGGQFDNDQLANFDEIMLKEVGFDALELDKIFELTPDRKEQADHALALRPETTIQPGDIFQLGSHRIMCGESGVEQIKVIIDRWEEYTDQKAVKVSGVRRDLVAGSDPAINAKEACPDVSDRQPQESVNV